MIGSKGTIFIGIYDTGRLRAIDSPSIPIIVLRSIDGKLLPRISSSANLIGDNEISTSRDKLCSGRSYLDGLENVRS